MPKRESLSMLEKFSCTLSQESLQSSTRTSTLEKISILSHIKKIQKSNHIECTHHSDLLKITKFFLTIDSDLVDKADLEYLEELDFLKIVLKTAKLLAEMNLRLARNDCKVENPIPSSR